MDFLEAWHRYFLKNSTRVRQTDRAIAADLTADERQLIASSIAAFQLGEHSEGKHLLKSAERLAAQQGTPALVAITRLFIAEEQSHALLLARFMKLNRIALIRTHWADVVFRRLRKHVSFELSVTVLITAEIISLVYYKALSASTNSAQLKEICTKILSDELHHVHYESMLISEIRKGRSAFYRAAIKLLHAALFAGTTVVVYGSHRAVLNRGGYGFVHFSAACWADFCTCFFAKPLAPAAVRA